MAAKVVMVAVPAVLGIASVRVYTVSEAPADGLVTREKLNVYTPLPQSAQVLRFVPETPGVIESGLTTARETILPVAQALRGACVSVKKGSVDLYHAGEDAYYYLKDPPPGFLPRFGTITMAGLLGMFLARRGSRFKRLAVPLGLMTAGVSVCYPAQAVAVLKVTGKKVYAAGQWSSAAVFSLLASRPKEITKEITATQTQSATVSNPDAAVAEASELGAATDGSSQNATTPEKEVESAESAPVSEEPISADTTKETSSVTLTQISTDTDTDPGVLPGQAEAEATPPSAKLSAPVESTEASGAKQAPQDASDEAAPAETTMSREPEAAAPAEAAEVKAAPSSEQPPAPKASDEPAAPAEPEPSAQPEVTDQPPAAAVEDLTPAPTPTPTPSPPPEEPAAENNKEGRGFKADPSLMDFGQSSPEDEDLYSTRS